MTDNLLDLSWVADISKTIPSLQERVTSLEKVVSSMQTNLIRSNAKKFGRTKETSDMITKLMMGARYDKPEKQLTQKECELLLNMLGVEERFC